MDLSTVFGWGSLVPLLSSAVVLMIPIGLAAVGETFCQRTGILNLGVEGMMLVGALMSFLAAFYSGSAWVGVAGGIVGGLAFGALKGLLSITLKTEQVVSGIVIVLLAQGLTSYLYGSLFHIGSTPPRIEGLGPVAIPILASIPGLGPVLFHQSVLVYLSVAVVVGVWWLLQKTTLGLHVRATGDMPAAMDAAGVAVDRIRWLGILVSGAMCGLAGSVLIIAQLRLFAEHITAGRGWIAIALVIFGRWKPLWVFAGAGLFGLIDALQLRVQASSGGINSAVPFEVFQVMPYLMTLVVLVVATARSQRDAQPATLGTHFFKEGRN